MFAKLKIVVDLILTVIFDVRKLKVETDRKKTILNILKTYFLIKDCVDEGEKLLMDAGRDTVKKIKAMESKAAIKTLREWDATLKMQGIRLYALSDYIFGQNHLAVINPKLQKKISKIVGYKMNRSVTLHGIGSALYLQNYFPINKTPEEKAQLIALMAGVKKQGVLDIKKSSQEIRALRQSLNEYRKMVERLVSDAELVSLSNRARRETSF